MIQHLRSADYYTQRNNELAAVEACMPTARVMFYHANRIQFINTSVMQDDDFFTSLMASDAAETTKDKKYSWAKGILAREVHGMYHTFLDRLVTGYRCSDFITGLEWEDYVIRIRSLDQSIMTSIAAGGLAGHAVVFTGYDKNSHELIMADPYGDPHTNYESTAGYQIRVNREQFNSWVKPLEKKGKWGHIPI